jgi:hypothetical protein
MNIAVIGRGNVGGGLARRWERAGHTITRIGRDGGDAADAQVALVAVPSGAITDALGKVGGLQGKVTIAQQTPSGLRGSARRRRWSGLGHGSTTMGRCCVSARCKTPASCCKPAAPGGLRQPLVRRSWTRRGSRRSSSGGDPYRMSISRSTAAASRNARRSAPSGVRYR